MINNIKQLFMYIIIYSISAIFILAEQKKFEPFDPIQNIDIPLIDEAEFGSEENRLTAIRRCGVASTPICVRILLNNLKDVSIPVKLETSISLYRQALAVSLPHLKKALSFLEDTLKNYEAQKNNNTKIKEYNTRLRKLEIDITINTGVEKFKALEEYQLLSQRKVLALSRIHLLDSPVSEMLQKEDYQFILDAKNYELLIKTKAFLVWAVGAIKDPKQLDYIKSFTEDKEPKVRFFAMKALGEIRTPSFLEFYKQKLASEKDVKTRTEIINNILTIDVTEPNAIQATIDILNATDHPWARIFIARQVVKFELREAHTALKNALKIETYRNVRKALLRAYHVTLFY